ncbi:Serine phosphatase RsbU, regulator of sigma subunit [Olavius sp. associated proteobacterium Delta 1]|nr:Serine phosphatase RsbU, regulator of sigma subunit [Olavius sp. associated proteobacterium Delta 1]
MTKRMLLHLKNEMLIANCLANFIGVFLVKFLIDIGESPLPTDVFQNPVVDFIDTIFTPFAFLFVGITTYFYERPIRRYLTAKYSNTTVSQNLASTARRRVLNEPFVAITLDFSMWMLSTIIYPVMFWLVDAGPYVIQRSIVHGLSIGLITVTVAFFMLEHVSQKRMTPHFFPDGGLYAIPRTLRIRIRTRLAALLVACNLIPLISIILFIQRIASKYTDPLVTMDLVGSAIIINSLLFIAIGIFLTGLVSRNLTLPLREIIQTLQGVRNGRFDKKVQVTSNDEIGYTGDVINEMTEGLKERDRIRQSLGIAQEVQQHLLPRHAPEIKGLDIAGQSIYCEETGGDYFDYLTAGKDGSRKVKIVVGDVSDHGVASALLMTTARAFIRQRASRAGNLNQIVGDVNRQISMDVEDSGRFMTLFLCEIDSQIKTIRWVNAGHDPAVMFDQRSGSFVELTGRALPLGVSEKAGYQESQRKLAPGQIILIGTDGIWESQNTEGQMFGKERFRKVIRTHAAKSAIEILQAVFDEIDEFCHPLENEDDVTLVVIKVDSQTNLN